VSSNLRQQTTTLIRERRKLFLELLHQGILSLCKAKANPNLESAFLKESCDYLMEAMRYDRSAPEGFLAMAYLLWLTGDSAEALLYLEEALLLDPNHLDAIKLRDLILPDQGPQIGHLLEQVLNEPSQELEDRADSPRPGIESSRRPKGGDLARSRPPRFALKPPPFRAPLQIDYEQLYIQLENRIQKEVKQISLLKPDWYQSTRDRAKVQKIEQQYAGLREKYREILEQIRSLEEEIDGRPLRKMLKPLEMILARCEYHLHLSWQMIQLQEMLDGHIRWINKELTYLNENHHLSEAISEKRFEYLLDDCDALADQLDELEQMGLESSRLIKTYELLAAKVSQFQDLRQEMGEAK